MSRMVLAISLALIVLLPACQGESGELPSTPEEVTAAGKGPCPTEINDMIASLFPRGLGNAAHQQCGNIARKLGRGDLDNAIGKTFNLIDFAVKHYEKGRLEDPEGGDPPTTEEGLTEFLNALLVWVGLDPNFAGNFDFEICKPNRKCVFETGTQFAGISATFTEPTLVTIARLPDDPGPFETHGFDDFPLFFDFKATSISDATGPSFGLTLASAPLAEPATVAVCVVDPPDPMAPDPDILPNIALGHVIQGSEGDSVEILPDAPPGDFALDCSDASSGGAEVDIVSLRWWGERAASAFEPVSEFMVAPLLANPGERRGLITAFSPVGAVDTTSLENDDVGGPTTTTLTLNEQASNLSITHGQIATATVMVDPAPGNEFEPSVTFVFSQFSGGPGPPTATKFLDDGKASVIVQCDTQGTLPPPDGGVEISTTRFARAEFPGAGDGAFEASDSNTLILGCSSALSPE